MITGVASQRFYNLSLTLLSIPLLGGSSLAQKPIEAERVNPPTPKLVEADVKGQIEKFNKKVQVLVHRNSQIFDSEVAKDIGWSQDKILDFSHRIMQVKFGPEADSAFARIDLELSKWRKVVDYYSELLNLKDDLENPAKRADLPEAVIDLSVQKISSQTEGKIKAAKNLIDQQIDEMQKIDSKGDVDSILEILEKQIADPRNQAEQLLIVLRDPSFMQSENLKVAAQEGRPIGWIGGAGLFLAAGALVVVGLMKSKRRTEGHFQRINENRRTRGTIGQQYQAVADATGHSIGGRKPVAGKKSRH